MTRQHEAAEPLQFTPIAHIRTDFTTKFGVPRQSGLVPETLARVVFTSAYREPMALRGLEGFSHLWLIWVFSEVKQAAWSPTVRPPRLGGNARMGVFATRSPYRPNPIGLSSVLLERVELDTPEGPVLWVRGADLMDGTPILDIKPYLPYTDSHPQASEGFLATVEERGVEVDIPPVLLSALPAALQTSLPAVLAQDPRPAYQDDPGRVYGMAYGGYDVRFTVADDRLRVLSVEKTE